MTESLYRKYRPQTFADVVGQDPIERTLRNALAQNKVSHAYLFTGPRGTGKTTTARLMAKALLCAQGITPDPDGTCDACQMIADGVHPDVYELDAASRTGVDNVREEIIGRVNFAPTVGRAKVYIIDEVHMLSTAAFNALLKTLEEPPDHVVFILCTTDPQKVPATIHSRCQRFDFHRISADEIVARLGAVCVSEGVDFEPEALALIADRSDGGMRNALTTLEQLMVFCDGHVTLSGAEDLLGALASSDMAEIVQAIGQRDAAKCFLWTAKYVETGADLAQFVEDLAARVRSLYVLSVAGDDAPIELSESERAQMASELRLFGPDRLARLMTIVGDLMNELRGSRNPRLAFEIALTRMVRPGSDVTMDALAERVETLERELARLAAAAESGAFAAGAGASRGSGSDSAPAAAGSDAGHVQRAAGDERRAGTTSPREASGIAHPGVGEAGVAGRNVVQAAMPQQGAADSVSSRSAAPRGGMQPAASQPVAPQGSMPANSFQPAGASGFQESNYGANPAQVASPMRDAASFASSGAAAQQRPTAVESMPASGTHGAASPAIPVSGEVARALANPAALQRMWKSAIDQLKKVKTAYGVLFMNTMVMSAPEGDAIIVSFPAANSFAYGAVRKKEVYEELQKAVAAAFGQPVTVRFVQEGGAGAPAPAPQSAGAPVFARQGAGAPGAPVPAPQGQPAPVRAASGAPVVPALGAPVPASAPVSASPAAGTPSPAAPAGPTSAPSAGNARQAQAPVPAAPAGPASAPSAGNARQAQAPVPAAATYQQGSPAYDEVPVDMYDEVPVDAYGDISDDAYGERAPFAPGPARQPGAPMPPVPNAASAAPAPAPEPEPFIPPTAPQAQQAARVPQPPQMPASNSADEGDIAQILASGFGDDVTFEEVEGD